jgi:hypothetical protein
MASERPLTKDMRADGEALTLQEYERVGGYQGYAKLCAWLRKRLPIW